MTSSLRSARNGAGPTRPARLVAIAIAAGPLLLIATSAAEPRWQVVGGDARKGPALIEAFGCAACHSVPGIRNANGNVGPPLTRFGDRTYIAGLLRNTPENLIRWIRVPQSVVPGNAMPDMGVTDAQARDIAAYLYTLR